MKLSQSSLSLLEDSIKKAVSKYACNSVQTFVTDIHLQPTPNSGEFSLFDDEDKALADIITIKEWAEYEGNDFYANTERILTTLLSNMKQAGCFDKLNILKPYSFVLVDEKKETIAELLLIDDDTLLLNEELLKGLDEELDAFLKELLDK